MSNAPNTITAIAIVIALTITAFIVGFEVGFQAGVDRTEVIGIRLVGSL